MPCTRSAASLDVPTRILHAATRLFAANGYEGTSLKDIASAVGIRKPSLLYHFPSKDQLRRRVLEAMLDRWNELVPRLLRAATSGEDQYDALLTETVGFFTADPDRARLLTREALDRPEEIGALVSRHVRPWADVVCRHIRKGQAQGRVHLDVDPEAYVGQIINLIISSIAIYTFIGDIAPPGVSADEMRRRHIDELCRVAKSSLFLSSPTPNTPHLAPAQEQH
jgi:AcrR family transcriptional regulator